MFVLAVIRPDSETPVSSKIRHNYFEIPLGIKVDLIGNEKVKKRFYFTTGYSLGIHLGSRNNRLQRWSQ